MSNIKRKKGLPDYQACGYYAQAGILLFGDKTYNYNYAEKKTTRPNKGLELVTRYSYTNMDDANSGIEPGKMTDISFAANYYLNDYVCLRVNYIRQKMV